VLYIARKPEQAEELARAEAPVLPGGPPRRPDEEVVAAHTRFGALLGFPPCCVAAFCARLQRGVTRRADGRMAHEDFVAAEDAAARTAAPLGRLNNLLPDRTARLIAFYPCRFDCETAARYAEALFAEVARAAPAPAAALRAALLGTVTLGTDASRPAAAGVEALTLDFASF
jgi:hypothetical protein